MILTTTSFGHNDHHQAISHKKKLVHIVQNRQFIWDLYCKVAQASFAFSYKTLCDRYAVCVL